MTNGCIIISIQQRYLKMGDEDDGTITINIDNLEEYTISHDWESNFGSYTYDTTVDLSGGYGPISFGNYKQINLELLDKYPAAKHLYNEFISVYNMCEAEEKLNGDGDDIPF